MASERHLGTDIALTRDGDLAIASNGDLGEVSGRACLVQDVEDRLNTIPGDLWAHEDFGCETAAMLGLPQTGLNVVRALRAIRLALREEPRIDERTLVVKALKFDNDQKLFRVSFSVVGESATQAFVVGYGMDLNTFEVIG